MRPQTRARFRHTLPRVRSLAGPRTGSAWCLFQPRALAFPTGLVRGLKAYGMTLMVAALATPAAAGESPKPGGILTYVIPADAPPSFDAHREGTFATVHSAAPFCSVLIRIDPDNPSSTTDFVCDLCTEMPQPTNGGKTYTFKIRNDKQAIRVAALRSDRAAIEFRGLPLSVRDELAGALGDKIASRPAIGNAAKWSPPTTGISPSTMPGCAGHRPWPSTAGTAHRSWLELPMCARSAASSSRARRWQRTKRNCRALPGIGPTSRNRGRRQGAYYGKRGPRASALSW